MHSFSMQQRGVRSSVMFKANVSAFAVPYFSKHQNSSSAPLTRPRQVNPVMSATHSKKPVIITDVLDTLVRDPFYVGMASHFNFDSFQEFLDAKTPNVWVDFELGHIDEYELAQNFFKERPPIDILAFKQFLTDSYQLLPGVETMLETFRDLNLEVHACSNYPAWTHLIEQAVGLNARFNVHWTFVSGQQGIRKPDLRAFTTTAALASAHVSSCILLDDRQANCEAAVAAGYRAAIHFHDVPQVMGQIRRLLSQTGWAMP